MRPFRGSCYLSPRLVQHYGRPDVLQRLTSYARGYAHNQMTNGPSAAKSFRLVLEDSR